MIRIVERMDYSHEIELNGTQDYSLTCRLLVSAYHPPNIDGANRLPSNMISFCRFDSGFDRTNSCASTDDPDK